jgi:hypothetical protein
MNSVQLTQVSSIKSRQAVDSNTLVFGDNNDLTIVLCELETADNRPDIDLVFQDDRVRAVNHQIVAIFSHDSEHGVYNDGIISDAQVLTLILLLIFLDI